MSQNGGHIVQFMANKKIQRTSNNVMLLLPKKPHQFLLHANFGLRRKNQ